MSKWVQELIYNAIYKGSMVGAKFKLFRRSLPKVSFHIDLPICHSFTSLKMTWPKSRFHIFRFLKYFI